MNIAILGTTLHAGVMAALLAEYGHQVFWCTDDDCGADAPCVSFHDEAVNQHIERQRQAGRLCETVFDALSLDCDVYLFCYAAQQQECALASVQKLARRPLIHPKLMINGSTFGLNGTARLQAILPHDHWAYFPDAIQEGNALGSVLNLKQFIAGAESEASCNLIRELLRPLFYFAHQYLFMPIRDAEFTKLSVSGMLATRISYMNDLALVAEKLGIDIANVQQGLAADSRIGAAYLSAGVGFGGENFSRDILSLSDTVSGTGAKSRLLEQVWDINEAQKELLFRKLWHYYHCDLRSKTVAVWGASFKENTASVCQSPIHNLLPALWAQGATVRLHDPQALGEMAALYGERDDLLLCDDAYLAAENADALCLLTAWKQYASPDFARLRRVMAHPLLLDGRNVYDPAYVKGQGFAYQGVGRL